MATIVLVLILILPRLLLADFGPKQNPELAAMQQFVVEVSGLPPEQAELAAFIADQFAQRLNQEGIPTVEKAEADWKITAVIRVRLSRRLIRKGKESFWAKESDCQIYGLGRSLATGGICRTAVFSVPPVTYIQTEDELLNKFFAAAMDQAALVIRAYFDAKEFELLKEQLPDDPPESGADGK